jgi:virulence-associated protein VagC
MNGDNQAVVLPKEFPFQGSEVYIKKIGSVIVLISKENPWQALFDSLSLFSEDFKVSTIQFTPCTAKVLLKLPRGVVCNLLPIPVR